MINSEENVKKSNNLASLLKLKYSDGLSLEEFQTLKISKIKDVINIDPNFFNNLNIKKLTVLDYYSSEFSNKTEKENFYDLFTDKVIFNAANFNKEDFVKLVSNVSNGILNNEVNNSSPEFKFMCKTIFKMWKKDPMYLISEDYFGGNVCSQILHKGESVFLFVNNELSKKHYSKLGIDDNIIKKIKENKTLLNEKSTFLALYFHIIKISTQENLNNDNSIIKQNMDSVAGNKKFQDFIVRAFETIEKDLYGDFPIKKERSLENKRPRNKMRI